MRLMTYILLVLLAFPAVLFLLGLVGPRVATDSEVRADPVGGDASKGTLFVLVHGMSPNEARWDEIVRTLEPQGQVLRLRYHAERWSNADPKIVAAGIGEKVQAAVASTNARRVVMVAHSMGALLTRRAMLDGRSQGWVARVERVVLMAGVNRGWDLGGDPPADVDPLYRVWMRIGYWGAHMLNMSRLTFSFERGSPFVADLRLEWMSWLRRSDARPIEVVQMIGDIDDVVSREDNQDLRVMGSGRFAQLRIRGTGHPDIVDFGADAKPASEERDLGEYRRERFLTATTAPFEQVRMFNDVQPFATEPGITEVVFVLHGIRDLGKWSADFETAIERAYPGRRAHLAIVSSRYGYFGMGPFLFEDVRNRYVRWFMDEYTETLARYPMVTPENIRFFGHSNGTYILAEALQTYKAMEIERVVFAGSVVPKAYDWKTLLPGGQPPGERPRVRAVRNYVGTADWVVALFPRFFELPVVSWLGNSIGSAGFNGFDDEPQVDNVRFVDGAHGAFESRVEEIVRFLLDPGPPAPAKREERSAAESVLLAWPSVLVTWALLAFVIVGLGTRVVAASSIPGWPVLLLYVLLVTTILRTI